MSELWILIELFGRVQTMLRVSSQEQVELVHPLAR